MGNNSKRKIRIINQAKVTKPTKDGEIGLDKLRDRNGALSCKWPWSYGKETNTLWREVLQYSTGGSQKGGDWVCPIEKVKSGQIHY